MNLIHAFLSLFRKPISAAPSPVAHPPAKPSTLSDRFSALWREASIKPDRLVEVARVGSRIVANRARYESIQVGVPWYLIGVIHEREASGRFDRHLANGDPLTSRTVNAPAGRPVIGSPPFTWEDAARDALIHNGIARRLNGTLEAMLDALERYNGLGYRNRNVLSPYIWGATTRQQPGKYIKDGIFDPTVMDTQIGCAAILMWLADRGHIELPKA